jgi:hypothetical protein
MLTCCVEAGTYTLPDGSTVSTGGIEVEGARASVTQPHSPNTITAIIVVVIITTPLFLCR